MSELEKEWARYKYWVMAKSHNAYNDIRSLFKDNQTVNREEFYEVIDSLKKQKESPKDEINAMEHIWGYFKKIASRDEKNQFLDYRDKYRLDQTNREEIKLFLYALSKKYDQKYLLQSYYFTK